MLEIKDGIRAILEAHEAVKPKERVLLIADNEPAYVELGQLLMDVIPSMGSEAVLAIINTPIIPMEGAQKEEIQSMTPEPPDAVAAGMKKANVIFRISDKRSLVHTAARREATAAGVRYFVIHPDMLDDIKRNISLTEVKLIVERTEGMAKRLGQSNMARVTNPAGTLLTMSLAGRKGAPLHPKSGIIRSLDYYGEAAIAPVEGSAEGIIVADLGVVQWGHLLSMPLRYTVEAGKVVDISGAKQDADRITKLISIDENASNIAELGIGTSHLIPLPIQGKRKDAGRLGTAHIGFGRNSDIGGVTSSQLHLDNLMSQAMIELDGNCVLKDGALLI